MLRSNIESEEDLQNITSLYLNKYCSENPIALVKEKLLRQKNPWNQIRLGQLASILAICDMKIDSFFAVNWSNEELKYRAKIKHHALIHALAMEKSTSGVITKDIYHDVDSHQAKFDYTVTTECAFRLLLSTQFLLSIESHFPNFSQNPDVIAEVIYKATSKLITEHKAYPSESQVWIALRTNPPSGYSISSTEYSCEEHILIAGQLFGRNAFRKRWRKYTA